MGNEPTTPAKKPLPKFRRNKYRFQDLYQNEPWNGEDGEAPEPRQFVPWDGKEEAAWTEEPNDGKQ